MFSMMIHPFFLLKTVTVVFSHPLAMRPWLSLRVRGWCPGLYLLLVFLVLLDIFIKMLLYS